MIAERPQRAYACFSTACAAAASVELPFSRPGRDFRPGEFRRAALARAWMQ
jgi:hypothetical protein